MNWHCLAVIWRTEQKGGEAGQQAVDSESQSFPVCSKAFAALSDSISDSVSTFTWCPVQEAFL